MTRTQFMLTGAVVVLLLALFFAQVFFRPPQPADGERADAAPDVQQLEALSPGENEILFVIDPTQSSAAFSIDEVMRGADFNVVGTTSEISGQLAFDPNNPSAAQLSDIVVNVRSLMTDNAMRNRAIQARILFTSTFESVRFRPITITGLPASVAVGDTVAVEIEGDLTILNATKPATFAATITYESSNRLTGRAATTIAYREYGVEVPLTQAVSFVADQVTLSLDFVALASER